MTYLFKLKEKIFATKTYRFQNQIKMNKFTFHVSTYLKKTAIYKILIRPQMNRQSFLKNYKFLFPLTGLLIT